MSSFSSKDVPTKAVRLLVHAPPGTEIFVLNHRFELVANALADMEADLPPGLYKLKFCAGNVIREQMIELPAESAPISIEAPEVPFSSAAPLPGTRLHHQDHEQAAYEQSRNIHIKLGIGSELFVLARTWTSPGWTPVMSHADPSDGLSLHSMNGRQLVDFRKVGTRQLEMEDAWSACTVALSPGVYRMRLRNKTSRSLEWTVVTCEGWQTQVYLLTKGSEAEASVRDAEGLLQPRVADPRTASVLMRRLGDHFEPNFRLTELARIALSRNRRKLGREIVREMLKTKFENPMLGIFGALLLLVNDNDRELAITVVKNVRNLVDSHPDLTALELALNLREPAGEVAVPPLLGRSWQLLLDASQANPNLIPSNSLAARIASRTWGDSAWLIWKPEELELRTIDWSPKHADAGSHSFILLDDVAAIWPESKSVFDADLAPSAERLTTQLAQLRAISLNLPLDKYERVVVPAELDDYETAIVRTVRGQVGSSAMSGMEFVTPETASLQLARSLSLPPGSIPQLVSRTLHKLWTVV